MRKFESIDQFRNVIKRVEAKTRYIGQDEEGNALYDHTKKLPVLKYKGTVKIHGTNAAIHFVNGDVVTFQSRNNEITPLKDNAGFAFAMANKPVLDLIKGYENEDVFIYGEWCGGNIQKNVGITGLPMMFVIFSVIVNNARLFDISQFRLPDHNIYNINDFTTYYVDIDFNDPQAIQNKLVELTLEVEKNCPVAAAFGSGNTCGEGIVWQLNETIDQFVSNDPELTFKVKGELHQVSKVITLAAVDVEKIDSIKEFVYNVVTDNRCNQGIEFLKEMKLEIDIKNTGDYVRWVYGDVVKEESDVIFSSGLEPKDIGGLVAKAAKEWYFNYMNQGK